MNQTRIKPSVKLFGLGDFPFVKAKVWGRKRFKLVNENELKLPRKIMKSHLQNSCGLFN